MKYLEREAFLFLPDVSKCNNFPENEEDFYDYFNINKKEKEHIINFSKNYKKYCNNI